MAKPPYKMPNQQKSKVFPIAISLVIIAMIAVVSITVISNKKPVGKSGKIEVSSTVSIVASTVNSKTGPDKLEPVPKEGSADTEIGKIVPTITAKDFQDKDVTIAPGKKPYVLAFVAHWCIHCQREIPLFVRLNNENKIPKNIEVYAIATGTDTTRDNFPPSKWLSREEWPWTKVADDQAGTLVATMGSPGFPYVVYVNADGTIQARTSGEQTEETIITNAQAISKSASSNG
ncbi:MAG: TlpA family protein disulfide reductase [Acidimicrobiia bacterium]|nr:TlpA family protein disulfide reductase [Acidimicrobiia bacterium]